MMFNFVVANELPTETIYVGQYNAVKVSVPATINVKYSEEFKIKLKSENNMFYKMRLVSDTLIIESCFNDDLSKFNSEDVKVYLRHPEPEKIINSITVNSKDLTISKRKSGNLKK